MIAIVNVSKPPTPFGPNEYEVRVNERVITTFTHRREDGLALCLIAAGKAVGKALWSQAYEEMGRWE
jgi:hypothetical protein